MGVYIKGIKKPKDCFSCHIYDREGDICPIAIVKKDGKYCPLIELQLDEITAAHEQIGFDKGFRDGYAQGLTEAEPKRGRWITKKDACGIDYQICSNCETEIQWRDRHGVILRVDMQNVPYCPYSEKDVGKMERSEE